MVKATLLGLEPSTLASQRDQCLPAYRLSSIYLSFLHPPHLFSPVFFLSIFLSPSPSFIFIHLSLSTPAPWPPFICPSLVFPSPSNAPFVHSLPVFLLRSLFRGSVICFPSTFTDLSFITSVSSPSVLLSPCSLMCSRFHGHSPLFHSSLSPVVHASIRGAHVLIHGAVLVQACRGLCALTFKRDISALLFLTCFRAKPSWFESNKGFSGNPVYLMWTSGSMVWC